MTAISMDLNSNLHGNTMNFQLKKITNFNLRTITRIWNRFTDTIEVSGIAEICMKLFPISFYLNIKFESNFLTDYYGISEFN